MSKKFDAWRSRVQAYCYELWGRGGFEMMTNLVWNTLWETEARTKLTEYEFAQWVVLQWCAHHYWHHDKPDLELPSAYADMKRVRQTMRRFQQYDEWYKAAFLRPAAHIAKTAANPPAEPDEEPDEPVEVGALEQAPRQRGKLRRLYSTPIEIAYELTTISPQAILIWVEQMTDWFADRGEFPTVQCLTGMIHRMPEFDYDEAVAASRTLSALYRQEVDEERAALRRLVERTAAPVEDAEKGKEAKEAGAPKVRPTSKYETRTGAAGAVTVTEGKKGGKKYRIWDHPVTAVLRWMGGDAWTFSDARKALELLGVPDVNDNTVKAQLIAGRKGGDCDGRGPAAALTTDQQNTLNNMVEDGEEAAGSREGEAGGGRRGAEARHGEPPGGRKAQAQSVPLNGTARRAADGGAPAVRPPDEPARLRGRAGDRAPGKAGSKGGVGGGGADRAGKRPTGRSDKRPHDEGRRGRGQDAKKGRKKLKRT